MNTFGEIDFTNVNYWNWSIIVTSHELHLMYFHVIPIYPIGTYFC